MSVGSSSSRMRSNLACLPCAAHDGPRPYTHHYPHDSIPGFALPGRKMNRYERAGAGQSAILLSILHTAIADDCDLCHTDNYVSNSRGGSLPRVWPELSGAARLAPPQATRTGVVSALRNQQLPPTRCLGAEGNAARIGRRSRCRNSRELRQFLLQRAVGLLCGRQLA